MKGEGGRRRRRGSAFTKARARELAGGGRGAKVEPDRNNEGVERKLLRRRRG